MGIKNLDWRPKTLYFSAHLQVNGNNFFKKVQRGTYQGCPLPSLKFYQHRTSSCVIRYGIEKRSIKCGLNEIKMSLYVNDMMSLTNVKKYFVWVQLQGVF